MCSTAWTGGGVNICPLLVELSALFSASGYQSEHLFPRECFLLDTQTGGEARHACLFRLLGIALSSGLRFPDAQTRSQQLRALGFAASVLPLQRGKCPQWLCESSVNVNFSAPESIQQPWADIVVA
jgi:hypothetical protein